MANLALVCNKGAVRSVNQDACCALAATSLDTEIVMAVVCDGVGGLARGEVASSTVVQGFVNWFERELPALVPGLMDGDATASVQRAWQQLLCELNAVMLRHGMREKTLMGTTFTGMLVCGGTYLVGHVGDCRAYIVHNAAIRQITQDQTLAAHMAAQGGYGGDLSKRSVRSNVILQSVGTQKTLKPAFYTGNVGCRDVCVLCSDGAYRVAGESGLLDALGRVDVHSEQGLREACDSVLEADMRSGERDNLTMVCFSGMRDGRGGSDGERR